MPYQFSFYEAHHLKFRENLHRHRCADINDNGHQCRNICIIGEPFCWVHLLWKHHLRIKTSTLPNAGLGCFAMNRSKGVGPGAVIFRKGEEILRYYGEAVTEQVLGHR